MGFVSVRLCAQLLSFRTNRLSITEARYVVGGFAAVTMMLAASTKTFVSGTLIRKVDGVTGVETVISQSPGTMFETMMVPVKLLVVIGSRRMTAVPSAPGVLAGTSLTTLLLTGPVVRKAFWKLNRTSVAWVLKASSRKKRLMFFLISSVFHLGFRNARTK